MGPDPNNVMRLGTDIRYAMNFAGEDGGRRIVIITPRVIGFREQVNQPRTFDYPFTLFEMRFDDPAAMRSDVRGRTVYLALSAEQGVVRMKPQNLLTNLPLNEA